MLTLLLIATPSINSVLSRLQQEFVISNQGTILVQDNGEAKRLAVAKIAAEWTDVPDSGYWEMNAQIATARLYLNYMVDEANAYLEKATDRYGSDRNGETSSDKFPKPYGLPYQHDWDFVNTYLLRAYFQFKDSPLMSAKAKENLRKVISFRSGTPSVSYSENHNAMIKCAAYFGNLLTGKSNTENKRWLLNFYSDKLKYHFKELNSPTYMGPEYRVLEMLYDYAPDADLQNKAKSVLDMLTCEQAVINVAGMQAGPFHRYYGNKIYDQSHDKTYISNHCYLGTPLNGDPEFPRVFSCFTKYQAPKIAQDIANAKKPPFVFKSRRTMAQTYYYVTPHASMATAQGNSDISTSGSSGSRGHVWDIVFDTGVDKVVFTGNREGSFEYDESDAVMKHNVLITSSARDIQCFGGVSAVSDGGWLFVEEGKTYVAIKKLSNGRILFEVRCAYDYGKPFNAFKSEVKGNSLSVSGDGVTYQNTYGETIKSPSKHSMEGDSFSYKLFDSPYLVSNWGSGIITVKYGSNQITIKG